MFGGWLWTRVDLRLKSPGLTCFSTASHPKKPIKPEFSAQKNVAVLAATTFYSLNISNIVLGFDSELTLEKYRDLKQKSIHMVIWLGGT